MPNGWQKWITHEECKEKTVWWCLMIKQSRSFHSISNLVSWKLLNVEHLSSVSFFHFAQQRLRRLRHGRILCSGQSVFRQVWTFLGNNPSKHMHNKAVVFPLTSSFTFISALSDQECARLALATEEHMTDKLIQLFYHWSFHCSPNYSRFKWAFRHK